MSWRRRRGVMATLAALMLALLLAACGSDEPPTSKIFEHPAWTGDERMEYDLVRDEELYGTCTLVTEVEFEAGLTKLSRLCHDDEGFRDDGEVVVDAETLLPVRSRRENYDPRDDETAIRTATYGADEVQLTGDFNGDRSEATRDLPEPDEESPDPGWYDDESLFWLVRGIPLERGWQGAYHNVNIGTVSIFVAEVEVEGVEEVEVPAGTFQTWRVRVESDALTNVIWLDRDAPHRMVQARIEDLRYVLTSVNQ